MSPASDEAEVWWPPTLVPSGFGRVLLAWWTMSALSQSTRFWIDSSVAMGASAMSSYLTAGRQDGPEDWPGRSARGRRERRLRLGDDAVAEEAAQRHPRPRHLQRQPDGGRDVLAQVVRPFRRGPRLRRLTEGVERPGQLELSRPVLRVDGDRGAERADRLRHPVPPGQDHPDPDVGARRAPEAIS